MFMWIKTLQSSVLKLFIAVLEYQTKIQPNRRTHHFYLYTFFPSTYSVELNRSGSRDCLKLNFPPLTSYYILIQVGKSERHLNCFLFPQLLGSSLDSLDASLTLMVKALLSETRYVSIVLFSKS